MATPRIAILAHRGGAREAPENTLAAIAHARRSGADGIELDVRLSAEGAPVVFHDPDLRRLAGSRRRVDESGLHALVAVELGARDARFAGERIPTLALALDAARGLDPIQLELKVDPDRPAADGAERLARAAVEEVRRRGLGRAVEISSFERAAIDAVRRAAPVIAAGLVFDVPPRDDTWLDFPLVSLGKELARAGWAARARARGLRVYVWTENDPASLPAWIALGVDGLITDRPDRMAEALRARGD
jgi:glycerophosphoryl diester phosphodiesterase